ncbi:MAG: hypothetical protein EZS28_012320 [Streblomastix strix]|uniref:Uncharacterized protein n=1 Tax=Streblomastix strix TaxID=222440 RepID=A0A5J4WBW1_9EUKA|nr:MAG: hypothetical protein EZS28_012320 [Streblomastix strix]
MKMIGDSVGYSILSGFINVISGSLSINNIEIKDIIISDSPIILISENAESISIINCQFTDITRTTIDDSTTKIGGTIEATIGGSSGQLSIQNTNFTLCISEQSYQAGAISLIIKNQGVVSISQTSFIRCESDQGSGIYTQVLSGGTLTIDGTCPFVCCKARLDLGASFYSTVSGTNSKLILKDDIQFEGFMKDQDENKQTQFGQASGAYIELSNDGIIEINKITLNDCKGINGGGMQINSLSAQKQTFNGTQFTNCVADQNGGGLYCIINSGEIEMNEIIMIECSGLNGGGIYSSIDQSGQLTIKDSCLFTSCSSTSGNGGGIYIDIDFSQQCKISVQSSTFDQCLALNPQISNIHKGFGSGIFISGINWDSINNGINLGQVEYINCEADQGDKGLFIVMNELRQLCRLGNPRGQYVQSKDYIDEISQQSLLMGYRGSPNQFESATSEDLLSKISVLEYYWTDSGNQWHISTMNSGINRLSCGLKANPCKTINYALNSNPLLFEGSYNPTTDIATMVLLEDDMIDTVININTDTILGNKIAIQSLNGGEGKTLSVDDMYKIGSNTESNTLFSVYGDGTILYLYQLKLNNLQETATSPLILLTGNSANNIDAQLHIENCIFAQSGNAPLSEFKHNLIQISGGTSTIKDVSISNYLFSNEKRVINVETIANTKVYQLKLRGTTISKIIQQGYDGGSVLKATINSGSSIQLLDYCLFEDCISESGFGGALNIVLDGGILNIKETMMKKCKALNGGGIYASISSMQQLLIAYEVYFEECEAFSVSDSQGRGGGIYINMEQNAPYGFILGVNLHFDINKASQYGRDLFVYCKNIFDLDVNSRFLFDVFNESYDKQNALYGTEFTPQEQLGRYQMINFDLLTLMLPFQSDIIYISDDDQIAKDSQQCGRVILPCKTLHYGKTQVTTPEWVAETIPQTSSGAQQINYTFIIIYEILITLPFETQADNVIIRGAFPEEYQYSTQRAILKLKEKGQIVCSDLAQWQQQGQLDKRGVNQNLFINYLEFVLPDDFEIKSIVKVIGNKESQTYGRNVEIKIEDCIIKQESPLVISSGFLKAEPFITQKIHIQLANVIAEECKTTKSGISSTIKVLESAQSNSDSFLPLWLREKEIQIEGSGLLISFERSMPTIKADGIQFSSQTISLEKGFELDLIGESENSTQIMQNDSTHHLFILEDSQLTLSELTVELWRSESGLIRSQGNQMSQVNGLRVNGRNLEGAFAQGSIFEVISGDLSLVDIKIKDVNIIENKQEIISENKRRVKMKGLIEMKENGQYLYVEKFLITNINVEQTENNNKWSSIMMNSGHLKLRDGTFLGEAYTSSGSAIRAQPTGPSTIDVEGVLFKGQGASTNVKGGAVYVDMREFDVQITFRRCIFIGNKADYGSNVFIAYSRSYQLIKQNSFIGCTAIVENSYEQDISVCYSVGNNEIFIDERNLIHSSWQRQKSEGVVRFIANSDKDHLFDPSVKCGQLTNPCDTFQTLSRYLQSEIESADGSTGRVETLIFDKGEFTQPFINISLARSDIINIVGSGKDQTQIISQPNNIYLMIQGGVNQIIVIERLTLALSPASPMNGFISTQGAEAGLVLQDMRVQGYLETSPYNTMLEPPYLFSIEGFVNFQDVIFEHIYLRTGAILQVVGLRRITDDNRMELLGQTSIGFHSCLFDDITSNETVIIQLKEKDFEKTTKFVFQDSIFSDCSTTLQLGIKDLKGGLLTRNMIYLAWGENESSKKDIKIITIIETLFTNCSAIIPGMEAIIEVKQDIEENSFYYQAQSNELYEDGEIVFDKIYKHGLIYIHSAVGSAITVTRLTLNLQDSIFVEPMCYGNMLYLNQTQTTINNCYFNGYNSTQTDMIIVEGEQISDVFCPNNPQYFSSTDYSLIYITQGSFLGESAIFEETHVGGIKDDQGYLIWPIENATKLPIYARGKVRSNQKAIYSMGDYTWLDNRKKWYGILISNDGKHFFGVDGKENEPVRLDVYIEEGEQFINFIRFELAKWQAWLVPPLIVDMKRIKKLNKYKNSKNKKKKGKTKKKLFNKMKFNELKMSKGKQ